MKGLNNKLPKILPVALAAILLIVFGIVHLSDESDVSETDSYEAAASVDLEGDSDDSSGQGTSEDREQIEESGQTEDSDQEEDFIQTENADQTEDLNQTEDSDQEADGNPTESDISVEDSDQTAEAAQVDSDQSDNLQNAAVQADQQTLPSDSQQEVQTLQQSNQVTYTFRNATRRQEHYEKHGIEMGYASAEEYEAAASAVVNNPNSLHKLEAEDGDDVYYLESENAFVIVSQDGYIRTYFYPSRGIDYYNAQ